MTESLKMTKRIPGVLALTIAVATVLSTQFVFPGKAMAAYDGLFVDTSEIGQDHHGVVSSDQFLELGVPSANGLRIEGEQSMRLGKLDRAIMVLQRSVELAPADMDGRILYGEALEKKLIKQKDRDPALYNYVIKQWLFVAKNAEFADQSMQGFNHLLKVCGTVPKKWEKEKKFLARVLIPEDGTAPVKLGRRTQTTM